MPRIGNEARLILKLGAERVNGDYAVNRLRNMANSSTATEHDKTMLSGALVGIEAYERTLINIQNELEER